MTQVDVDSGAEAERLAGKVNIRVQKILQRIGFFGWTATIAGGLLSLAAILFYFFVASGDAPDDLFNLLLLAGLGGLAIVAVGLWMLSQKKAALSRIGDLDLVSRKVLGLGVATLFIGVVITIPLALVFALWGLVAIVVIVLLTYDIFALSLEIQRLKSHKSNRANGQSASSANLRHLIYPKVKHDKAWHRGITVIGWIATVLSWGLLFPIYFGIVQRIIYFIAYGDNKSEWLAEEEQETPVAEKV